MTKRLANGLDDATVVRRLVDRMRAPRLHARRALEPLEPRGIAEYDAAVERLELRVARLRDPRTWVDPPATTSFLVVGPFGTGKTLIAVRMLAAAYVGLKASGRKLGAVEVPLFVKAREATEVRFIKSGIPEDEADEAEALRERIFGTRFLVLDDLGRIAGYKGEEEFLERVIESRYENELVTAVTASKLTFESARLVDFVESAAYEKFVLSGESGRKPADG